MRGTRIGTGASPAAVVAACGLAPAPSAVAPGTATVDADRGSRGGGDATLTAARSSTSAALTTSAVTAPLAIGRDALVPTLTPVEAGGGTTVFKGTKNPPVATGDALEVGPLSGTVASGDSPEAFGGTLKVTAFGFLTLTCTAQARSHRARSSSTDTSPAPPRGPHDHRSATPLDRRSIVLSRAGHLTGCPAPADRHGRVVRRGSGDQGEWAA